MSELLAPEGILAGLLFNRDFGNPLPPFGGSEEGYRSLFENQFEIQKLQACDRSIPQRAGSELFFTFKNI